MIQTTRAEGLALIARALTINHRKTSERTPWVPYREQMRLWELLERYRCLLVAKPRKTGISTAVELADLAWTYNADCSRQQVRTVFAIDEDDKAGEHLDQYADFADQLSLPGHRVRRSKGDYQIRFRNGSRIDCITAGGSNPGRGGNINRLHVTELPFWARPRRNYQHLRSACHDNPIVVIETTMDSIDEYCEDLWTNARAGLNEFHPVMWLVEDHESYRMRADLITNDEWAMCQKEGFRKRTAAAWWLKHALPNLCTNDMLALMHDFPQRDEHLFAAGTGRVILATPPPAVVYKHLEVGSISGDVWRIEVYADSYLDPATRAWTLSPIRHSGQVVISIDTAMGRGKTNSVIMATDKRDRRPLASMWSPLIRYDDIARCADTMRQAFSSKRYKAVIVCENDGVGDATTERMDARGIQHQVWSQVAGNKERCITATKRRVEAGVKGVPKLLRDEVKKFHRNERGEYEGQKDAIMTYGMALAYIEDHPYEHAESPEEKKDRASRVYLEERLREDRMVGGASRPAWGA